MLLGCGFVELKITTPSLLANAPLILLDLKSFVSTLVNTNYTKIQYSQLSLVKQHKKEALCVVVSVNLETWKQNATSN